MLLRYLMSYDNRVFLKGGRRLDFLFSIKLLTVWQNCPSKASKNTRRNLDRLAIQLASMVSLLFKKNGVWNWIILVEVPALTEFSVHPFRLMLPMGYCKIVLLVH